MKRLFAVLLGISLVANLALVAVFIRRGESTVEVAAPPAPASTPAARTDEPPGKTLDRLRSENAHAYAGALREAGVAPRAARLLVADALREKYLEKQRELIGSGDPQEFWKTAASATDREKQAALRKLAREQEDLLREIFGPDAEAAAENERLARIYGPLPEEKLAKIDRIHSDYGGMAEDVRSRSGGLLLPADREALEWIERERRKDVAEILTPEELEFYDLQVSPTARTLRARLATFGPTEQEFRALFRLQREFDERFGAATGGVDESRRGERAAAETELEGKIRTALGEARYEEYRRQQDPGYRTVARIAERFGLPPKRADEVMAFARSAQARLQTLRDDKAATPEAVRQALAAIGREASERLTALLGAEGVELYRMTSGGAWLGALEKAASEVAAKAGSPPPKEGGAAPAETPPPVPAVQPPPAQP